MSKLSKKDQDFLEKNVKDSQRRILKAADEVFISLDEQQISEKQIQYCLKFVTGVKIVINTKNDINRQIGF